MRELTSKEAEENVIASLMMAPEEHHLYFDTISADDFFFKETKQLYAILEEFYDNAKPMGTEDIADEYVFQTKDKESSDYVYELAFKLATSENIENHVEKMSNLGKKRRLVKTCEVGIQDGSMMRSDVDEVISDIETSLQNITMIKKDSKIKHYREAMKWAIDNIKGILENKESSIGYSTGFVNLDTLITLRRGEMVVIGARPSLGKSSLAGCLAANLNKNGVHTYIATLEMKAEMFLQRLIFADIGANQYTIKNMSRTQLEQKLLQVIDKSTDANIWFDDVGRDWGGIKRRIRRAVKNVGIQVAIIDYIQLITIKGKFFSRENQVATISAEIKALALELEINIIILAQLGRQTEGKPPKMCDLRESGALEQDADIVMLLHRERDTDNAALKGAERVEAALFVPKNRNGRTGVCNLYFHPATTEFKDRLPEYEIKEEQWT